MFTRVVWLASDGTSVPRPMMRILPASTSASPTGGTDQPMSIWPDMTWVGGGAAARVGVGLARPRAASHREGTSKWLDAPAAETPAVLPAPSFNEGMGESARAYQNRSDAPCHSASKIRTGAFRTYAPMTP